MMEYRQAVDYIEEIPKFTKKHPPGHTRKCLRLLGSPEKSFRILHVAGTNGKGSTCAFLDSVLRHAGYRCGLFTSPHLVDLEERFVIDGEKADRKEFLQAFEMVYDLAREMEHTGEEHPTYFEFLFLMGMVLFERAGVEIAVLETGLGGRLDATTEAEDPELCVITSVSLDHMQYLGNTVEEIAAEKAGIMVPGVPVVFDGNDDRVKRVLEEHAVRLGCPAVCVTKEEARITEYTESSIVFRTGDEAAEREYRIPFIAEYQVMNALLAISAIRTLAPRLSVPEEALKEGLREACWEGRMEQVLPGVYLDGAHNEDGVRQFIKTAARLGKEHRIGLVFSAVSDKDYPRMVQEMTEQLPLSFAVTTQVGGGRQVPAGELAELFRRNGCERVIECPFPAEAFAEALRQKQEKEILFCVGSLYLVGEIKALINRRSTGMEIQI